MIKIQGLSKRFGDFYALRNIDLHVKPGELFGFLGPNGAGKTTTMKIMMGLMKPTEGRVWLGGVDVMKNPVQARRMAGYIPDRPYLYEKLSGKEFLSFIGGLWGVDSHTIRKQTSNLMEVFDLTAWADELIESYSHGMKQRLTMAAAFLHKPRLLVVDEPMVGLDPRGAKLVKSVFRSLVEKEAGTVFLSTHTLEVAEQLCDRVAVLHRGKIVAVGSVEELRRQVGDQGTGRLEELFLELTGGADIQDALRMFAA